MIKKNSILFIFSLFLFFACSSNNEISYSENKIIKLEKQNDSLYLLYHVVNDSVVSSWQFNFEVKKISVCYLNEDSIPEIAVMVNKSTRYWKKKENRLFIFKLYKSQYIRPLWLGSKTAGRLTDFSIQKDSIPNLIVVDCVMDNCQKKAVFTLGGFGLQFLYFL